EWRYLPSSASGPTEERTFRWNADILAVLRKHARQAPAAARGPLDARIDRLLRSTVVDAYVRGRRGDRGWASRYLRQIARRHPTRALLPLAYLVGLWSPRAVTAIMSPIFRSRFR